jgi:hypothetical protein
LFHRAELEWSFAKAAKAPLYPNSLDYSDSETALALLAMAAIHWREPVR